VEHLIEVRKATGDVVRLYSERQFSQMSYKLPEDEAEEQKKPACTFMLQYCGLGSRRERFKNSGREKEKVEQGKKITGGWRGNVSRANPS
jgi:hypothetical protein